MEMDLLGADIRACRKYVGSTVVEVPMGKSFKVELAPDGEEIVTFACEAGKKVTVTVSVAIEEVDE